MSKGDEAVAKIEVETGVKGLAEVRALDLSSFESVKEFAREFKSQENVLDVLVNSNDFCFSFQSCHHKRPKRKMALIY